MNAAQTKQMIINNLKWNEIFIEVSPDDVLMVSRNTKGNQIPAFTQEMTMAKAVAYGEWDTTKGTMESIVTMSPNFYENAIDVHKKNGLVYGIFTDDSMN